jgi:hypothetical protein
MTPLVGLPREPILARQDESAKKIASNDTVIVRKGNGNGSNG